MALTSLIHCLEQPGRKADAVSLERVTWRGGDISSGAGAAEPDGIREDATGRRDLTGPPVVVSNLAPHPSEGMNRAWASLHLGIWPLLAEAKDYAEFVAAKMSMR